MVKIVLDTTLLSNFSHIQRPDLLRSALGDRAVTIETILAELRVGINLGWVLRCDWLWLTVIAPTEQEMILAADYRTILDKGECECLAVAAQRGWVFATDDLAARRLAQRHGVAISGTLGVLRKLVALGLLTIGEADGNLAVMMERGYRAPVRSLRDL